MADSVLDSEGVRALRAHLGELFEGHTARTIVKASLNFDGISDVLPGAANEFVGLFLEIIRRDSDAPERYVVVTRLSNPVRLAVRQSLERSHRAVALVSGSGERLSCECLGYRSIVAGAREVVLDYLLRSRGRFFSEEVVQEEEFQAALRQRMKAGVNATVPQLKGTLQKALKRLYDEGLLVWVEVTSNHGRYLHVAVYQD